MLDGKEFSFDIKLPNTIKVTLDVEDLHVYISHWEFLSDCEDMAWDALEECPKCEAEIAKMKKELKQFDEWIKKIAKEHNIESDDIYEYLNWC